MSKINTIQLEIPEDAGISFCGDLHADLSGPESRLDDYMHTIITKITDIYNKSVMRNIKAVIFTGDIFNRVSVPHECINLVGETFMKFKKGNIRVFSIVGNHDIARNNMERLIKSPLQTLFTFEVVEHLSLSMRLVINKKLLITPVDYVENPIEAFPNAKYNMMLAHMFYNSSELFAAGNHNLKEEDVLKLGYDCMFLGHDHVPYPIMKVGKTDIVRPGSIIRGTSHEYNFNRIPCFYTLKNPAEYNTCNWEKIEIEAKPFEQIASNSVMNKKNMNSLTGLQDVLSNLAERIAGIGEGKENDRIIEIIKTDSRISNEIRALLFQYFVEAGISIR